MRAHIRSSVVTGIAVLGISSLVMAPSPPQPHSPPTVTRQVQLTAAPALGAIPLAFIRNQFQYCSLICPFAVQGAITLPIAIAQTPATLLGALASTGSPLAAIGAALASVTGPANAAATPLFNNDVFLVVPKAFHALDVAIVEAFNVGAAVFTPGGLLAAIQNARTNILAALNQPVGPPTTPTGARNILQVVAVEAANVTTAVAFQAGELLLLGVIQTADAAAQELARTGNPVAAVAAGAAQAGKVINQAGGIVATAVNTAVTNINNSLHDPFPAAAKTTTAGVGDPPAVMTASVPLPRTLGTTPQSPSSKTDSATSTASDDPKPVKADTGHTPKLPKQADDIAGTHRDTGGKKSDDNKKSDDKKSR
jgi:hypothetical protein